MKKLLFTGLFAALIVACFAQKPYKVVFYNFENLFDTIRNPEIYDEEFTPEGPKKWNTPKYTKKINNLSRVLFDIAAINKDYPVVIGVSEIENRNVMEDVIATPKLAPANYRIVHYDSPDARGVDVAFYYRPDVFKLAKYLLSSYLYNIILTNCKFFIIHPEHCSCERLDNWKCCLCCKNTSS